VPSPFEIELLEQHWLDDDSCHRDKCSHGRLRISIAGCAVGDASEDNYGISTSALALLRTLESDHSRLHPIADRLVFHGCGAILLMCCPVGIDWSVRHESGAVHLCNAVTYPTVREVDAVAHPEAVACVPLAEYRSAVLGLASAVDDFFRSEPPRDLEDPFDQQDYAQFWEEFRDIFDRQRDR
jgi:hypothetical protein